MYFWVNLNVTVGPLVIETPPMSLGVIDDIWFRWVTDFGLPGPDRGEGGRYLLVPPGYTGELPANGYIVCKLRTFRATALGRQFLENNDPKPAVALVKKTLKVYRYLPGGYGTSIAAALDGSATLARTPEHRLNWSFLQPREPVTFTEGTGKVMNTIPPNDFSYFELINDLVQREPASALDPEIMGSLAAIGIVKGQPFNPDARMKKNPDRCGGHRNGRKQDPQLAFARLRGVLVLSPVLLDQHALCRRLRFRNAAGAGHGPRA